MPLLCAVEERRRNVISAINQALGRRADAPQKNWRSPGASGGGGAYRRFSPPLQPPARSDRGLWLGLETRCVLLVYSTHKKSEPTKKCVSSVDRERRGGDER